MKNFISICNSLKKIDCFSYINVKLIMSFMTAEELKKYINGEKIKF